MNTTTQKIKIMPVVLVSFFSLVLFTETLYADELSDRRQGIVHYDGDPVISCGGSGGGSGRLTGGSNVEQVYNYFIGRGLTPAQSAGITGNFQAEAGIDIDPAISQHGGGPGRGIAQWEYYSGASSGRGNTLIDDWAPAAGVEWDDLEAQLDFAWWEMTGEEPVDGITGGTESGALTALQGTDTAESAAVSFARRFERNADSIAYGAGRLSYEAAFRVRIDYAEAVFAQFSGNSTPEISGRTGGSSCNAGTANAVILDGYAFPIEGVQSDVQSGYTWPCSDNCHHDGSPAFDLSHAYDDTSEGLTVFAITDGYIRRWRSSYTGANGIEQVGCNSFQLEGDDGWSYWYGHIMTNPDIGSDRRVSAGDPIAVIGERRCTGNGSYPHLHIDRGSPMGSGGGRDCCRHESFVPLMNGLYDALP